MLSNSTPNRQDAMTKHAAYDEMALISQTLMSPAYSRVDTINLDLKAGAEKQKLEKRLVELVTQYRPVWEALCKRWNQCPAQEERLAA